MKTLLLDGEWQLYYTPESGGKPDSLEDLNLDKCNKIPANVPGNVELDLMHSRIEEDPFIGENIHHFRKYEYYQWIYSREITIPSDFEGDRIFIRFNGIDTIADIYIEDEFIGRTENMFIEHEFDITDHIKKESIYRLYIHIHSAMNHARNGSYTVAMRGTAHRNEICIIRKAPHCFGWDIAPRLVSAGLWRSVELVGLNNTRLIETYYATPKLYEDGTISIQYAYRFKTDKDTLEDFQIRISGQCGDSNFFHETPAWFVSGNNNFIIQEPELWWPKGYGDQPLYDVKMELLYKGAVIDKKIERIGLRSFELIRSFEKYNQQFQLIVNNVKIFAKGTNWVPLDALHSRDVQRLHQVHDLCVDSGVNIIRCWGGNVYEDHAFFSLCDEHGIMVWQDFAMGNTNYPQTQDFISVMEHEASAVIRKLRNHPSLVLWSGDNEVDFKNTGFEYPNYASRYNRVAHELLPRLTQAHDPYRLFIASSPEIPEGFSTDDVPEQHTWGVRAYFKDDFYKHSSACFIGEVGYHGCPAVSSLQKFIPAAKLWPYNNTTWAVHSTEDIRIEPVLNRRNHLMADQIKILFGVIPEDIHVFSLLSQISQAEAMKFFVERTRALKWRRTGIIWWNMADGWPQISDAVVDYYYTKKLAYFYLKRVQKPVLLLMGELSGWNHDVILSNDTCDDKDVSYRIVDADNDNILLSGTRHIKAGENAVVDTLREIASEQKLYLLYWNFDGIEQGNHYLSGYPPYDIKKMISRLDKIRMLPEAFEIPG